MVQSYDIIVIGGGSGGLASARRSAKYGAKVLLIEGDRMGGTCVNLGCVPKKVMCNASDIARKLSVDAEQYCFGKPNSQFDWSAFKVKRDEYLVRLNKGYEQKLKNENVEFIYGWADFVDAHTIEVTFKNNHEKAVYTAKHIVIAVGGTPLRVNTPAGADKIGITSDGFFELTKQPKRVALVGSGYISVELAGVFNALGSETHLLFRGERILRPFDIVIGTTLGELYAKHGVHLHPKMVMTALNRLESGEIEITMEEKGETRKLVVDELVWAVGRMPVNYKLALSKIGVEVNSRGKIVVDEYQNTTVKGVYALGDDCEEMELTPVAIAAGRKLGDRLFGNKPNAKLDYTNIPSAIFSHPEAGTVGISEAEARQKYENVKVYQSKFVNLYYSPMEPELKDPSIYKIVCVGPEEKVVGVHLVGDHSSEILQGFGVAVKMGATKKDLDSCVAIHPTAAEELVTLK